jgi:hypothetical protein
MRSLLAHHRAGCLKKLIFSLRRTQREGFFRSLHE